MIQELITLTLHILTTGHYLTVPTCAPGETWQYIPTAGIHACHNPLVAQNTMPNEVR